MSLVVILGHRVLLTFGVLIQVKAVLLNELGRLLEDYICKKS